MTSRTKKFVRDTAILAVGSVISYFLIPMVVSRYHEIQALRDARLKTAIAFGENDTQINKKLNSLAVFLEMFNSQRVRMKTPVAELKETQLEFEKKYTERYLALDAIAWWWQSESERQAGTLRQLTPDELKQLDQDIRDYTNSVAASAAALRPLWHALSSQHYRIDEKSQKNTMSLQATMEAELQKQHQIRYDLVQKISQLFGESNFRTGTADMYTLWKPL